jgi:hypothetical protein
VDESLWRFYTNDSGRLTDPAEESSLRKAFQALWTGRILLSVNSGINSLFDFTLPVPYTNTSDVLCKFALERSDYCLQIQQQNGHFSVFLENVLGGNSLLRWGFLRIGLFLACLIFRLAQGCWKLSIADTPACGFSIVV